MTFSGLDPLREMAYPGRGIILGQDPTGRHGVVIYFITGRSASSQARVLVREGTSVWTKPSGPEILKKGNPELLIYPAVIVAAGIAVSNGRQTSDIASGLAPGLPPQGILAGSLASWEYEPDAPIYTPRISGCLTSDGLSALSLIRRSEDGAAFREVFDVPQIPGRGLLLTTYRGNDRDPVLSFEGKPLPVRLESSSAAELAEAVFEALAPPPGAPDYRVAAACVTMSPGRPFAQGFHIINLRERT